MQLTPNLVIKIVHITRKIVIIYQSLLQLLFLHMPTYTNYYITVNTNHYTILKRSIKKNNDPKKKHFFYFDKGGKRT